MPRVSVVIATRHDGPALDRAIASVVAQSLTDWELLVVDDASTDDTPRRLRRWALREPRLKAIRLPVNVGSATARNHAWRRARAEWIAILDGDDVWWPDKLARQLAAVEQRPEAVWSYTGVRLLRAGEPVGERLPPASGELTRALWRNEQPVYHSSVLYRRAALVRLGGFVDAFRRGQDWDLFLRLVAAYGPAAAVPVADILTDYTLAAGPLRRAQAVANWRCQAAIIATRAATGELDPTGLPEVVDAYVERALADGRAAGWPAATAAWAGVSVALSPARRWRWRRWWAARAAWLEGAVKR